MFGERSRQVRGATRSAERSGDDASKVGLLSVCCRRKRQYQEHMTRQEEDRRISSVLPLEIVCALRLELRFRLAYDEKQDSIASFSVFLANNTNNIFRNTQKLNFLRDCVMIFSLSMQINFC